MAHRRGKRSLAGRMLHHMKPNRVAARFVSGGHHQTFKSIVKSPFMSRTVHTPKTGRRAYEQRMAVERKARVAAAAKARKQAVAEQKAARAQLRKQQPRQRPPRRAPVAVNARTGKPITWAQAQAAVNAANREAARIERELAGNAPRKRAPRKTVAPKPELTPLQQAIAEVKGKQAKTAKPRKTAAKKPGRPKPTTSRRARPAKKQPNGAADVIAGLIPARAILTPQASGRATPQPTRTRASRRAQRGVYGAILRRTCACGGTGRIPVFDSNGDPHGSTSCPEHGRGGRTRGRSRWTMRGAIRESGLPGLAARLERKRKSKRGNADERQRKAHREAANQVRYAGPTRECGQCENSSGIADKPIVDRLRDQFAWKLRAEIDAQIRMAEAHNRDVESGGEGKKVKVPKAPSEAKLRAMARVEYPYAFCTSCRGLGRISSSVNTPGTSAGQFPVAEWRADADLRDGHRSTARERSTGRRQTENAARVERRRKLPRL